MPNSQLYIPPLGSRLVLVDLMDFSTTIQLDEKGKGTWELGGPSEAANEAVINRVGAFVEASSYAVWEDHVNKGGAVPEDVQLKLCVRLSPPGGALSASWAFSLFHLRYFWPQLHDLKIPLQLRDGDVLSIEGVPHARVVLCGIKKTRITK